MKNKWSWIPPLFKRGHKPAQAAYASSEKTRDVPIPSGGALMYDYRYEDHLPVVWNTGDVLLDLYEVTGILGEGGMGIVYKVHVIEGQSDMAVKCPRPEIFTRAGGQENFVREAETWVKLSPHPHLVKCYFVHTLGGIPRVFAEYIEGGNLAEWIRNRKLYEGGQEQALARMLDVAIQFAWGLHFAHEQGLVHQDVKPANVMMTVDGAAKVTDFGLAKARAMAGEVEALGTDHSILVSSGGMTPAYSSPEQAAHQSLSRKTDIWSWGVSVLEMFVGKVTWMAGIVAREALSNHEREDAMIPVMPPEVVALLGRCFQPQPEDRPATMLQVATELQTIYAHLVGHPYPREMPGPTEEPINVISDRAFSLFHLGRFQEAVEVYDQLIRRDPERAYFYYAKGSSLKELGRLQEAVAVFDQALRRDRGQGEIYIQKGNVLQQLDRFQEAVDAFDRALALNPQDANVYSNKGNALRRLGRSQEALTAYEQALAIDPGHILSYTNKGNALRELGRLQEALTAYERALAIDPDLAIIYYNKGIAFMSLQQPREAIAAFDQALARDPNLVLASENKATALQLLQLPQVSVRKQEQALAYYRKGIELLQMQRLREALTSFEQAIALDPGHAYSHHSRGFVLQHLSRPQEALVSFERVIALKPQEADAYVNKGNALLALKRLSEAIKAYEQALAVDPKLALAARNKGAVLRQLKRPQEALASFEQAIALDQQDANAHYSKGNALLDLKRPREALAAYEQALAIDPRHEFAGMAKQAVLRQLKHT